MLILIRAFLAGTIIFAAVMLFGASEGFRGGAPPDLIRLHILANSDSPEDQAVKFMVKEAVVGAVSEWFDNDTGIDLGIDDVRSLLLEKLPAFEIIAENISGLTSAVRISHEFFPARTYKSFSLPAGIYEALVISIGGSSGNNWWCVLFPPLCLIEAVISEDRGQGAGGRSSPPYFVVDTETAEAEAENARFRFRVVEIWEDIRNFISRN